MLTANGEAAPGEGDQGPGSGSSGRLMRRSHWGADHTRPWRNPANDSERVVLQAQSDVDGEGPQK